MGLLLAPARIWCPKSITATTSSLPFRKNGNNLVFLMKLINSYYSWWRTTWERLRLCWGRLAVKWTCSSKDTKQSSMPSMMKIKRWGSKLNSSSRLKRWFFRSDRSWWKSMRKVNGVPLFWIVWPFNLLIYKISSKKYHFIKSGPTHQLMSG